MLKTTKVVPALSSEAVSANQILHDSRARLQVRANVAPSDYWIISLDRTWAVRSARGMEAEGFDCIAAARHWIEEREAEEADELAALVDFEADQIREAA